MVFASPKLLRDNLALGIQSLSALAGALSGVMGGTEASEV